ncbi:EAL domain-containing protein (putative c-di-GMP-specific phosphodiesterase class I) [Blastomonas natatoria]|uniref:EAL domain-containing protein (Putative c-di-GMP-specific phosphodiesterase class I) n=1 Tax=Blastomonas natatoria TaxID=34015 RepID=A0A2V3VBQ1_9SPHN|nr:EAL domain-containing protein [Blastomonas natatoria]PXW79127.1 EAL domain-containing protein (putative c-di-GMP-specific phosphodiesterase class I) [Blastomonas natatoria]
MASNTPCSGCREGAEFALPITMAFQPIIDARTGNVFAHEALVRGSKGEGADQVLGHVSDESRYVFDQQCRVKAIELAASLGFAESGTNLSINFLPNAVYEPRACIRLTLTTAMKHAFPLNRIIFEFTETEKLDTNHLLNILRSYRAMGFKTAIDDFGSGYAGLGLLAKFQPDIVKIDMDLIRNIDTDRARRSILKGTLDIMADLGVEVVCEGIETLGEYQALADMGVGLMQGYLFARPALAAVSPVNWPEDTQPSLRAAC